MLYASLTPLLPHLLHELGLSKSRAGVLVAAYAGGALVGGLLGGLVATYSGPRRAVLAGLALLGLASAGLRPSWSVAALEQSGRQTDVDAVHAPARSPER